VFSLPARAACSPAPKYMSLGNRNRLKLKPWLRQFKRAMETGRLWATFRSWLAPCLQKNLATLISLKSTNYAEAWTTLSFWSVTRGVRLIFLHSSPNKAAVEYGHHYRKPVSISTHSSSLAWWEHVITEHVQAFMMTSVHIMSASNVWLSALLRHFLRFTRLFGVLTYLLT